MWRWKRLLVGAGVCGLLLGTGARAGGQDEGGPFASRMPAPLGNDFRIGGPGATGEDSAPTAAWSRTTGRYLVVWQDGRDAPTRGFDVYGRRIGGDGALVGNDFRISGADGTGDELRPAVAWNGATGQFLVVWQDQRDSSGHHGDIYGRRVSAAGAVVGADFRISGPEASGERAVVVWNGTANEYLVVWMDDRDDATRGCDVYGRRVSAAGSVVGVEFRVSSGGAVGDEVLPAVAWNGTDNQYLVVWMDSRREATRGWDIYGRRLRADGGALGRDFRVTGRGATEDDAWPTVAWNGSNNQYLVVWGDSRNASSRGSDIYGRRVSGVGAAVGSDLLISGPGATANDESPVVVWNGTTDEYLVVWMDGRDDAHRGPDRGCDIYGRRVATTGAASGEEFRISGAGALTDDVWPAVAWDGIANRYLVVWSECRDYLTRNWDVWGRQVTG